MAAATAARTLRRLGHAGPVTMVCGEGVPPYSRPALMYALMGHVRPRDTALHADAVWQSLRVTLVAERASGLDLAARRVVLDGGGSGARGDVLDFDRLLVATGSRPRPLGVPGEDLSGVVRFWGIHDLAPIVHAAEAATASARGSSRGSAPGSAPRAVVVGGGLSGIELCECLAYLGLRVTLLVREARVLSRALDPAESDRALAAIHSAGVKVRFGASVAAIDEDGATGRVASVTLGSGEALGCAVVGVTVGVVPDVAWLEGSGVALGRGVCVDGSLRVLDDDGAPLDGVMAAGDCAELGAGSGDGAGDGAGGGRLEQLWYTARAQGAVAAYGLAGTPRRYAPGVAFNSAKVFDTEWQAYGEYDAAPETSARWTTHRWHDARRGATLRMVEAADGRLVAVSAMGARLRGEVVRAWIAEGRAVDDVRRRLAEIAFDAEFDARRFVAVGDGES